MTVKSGPSSHDGLKINDALLGHWPGKPKLPKPQPHTPSTQPLPTTSGRQSWTRFGGSKSQLSGPPRQKTSDNIKCKGNHLIFSSTSLNGLFTHSPRKGKKNPLVTVAVRPFFFYQKQVKKWTKSKYPSPQFHPTTSKASGPTARHSHCPPAKQRHPPALIVLGGTRHPGNA